MFLPPEIVVAITAHNRPHYLQRVMTSWVHAGVHQYPVVFQCEPVNDEVISLCRTWEDAYVKVNEDVYGALGNPWYAIESGFDLGAEFVILGEDDSIVASDILNYFKFCYQKYQNFQRVRIVCSFVAEPLGDPYEVFLRETFTSVIWGIWRDRWEESLRDDWGWDYAHAWDGRIIERLGGHRVVFPGWSRSQHIGQYDGTHMPPDQYDQLKSKCFYTEGGGSWG